MADRRRRAERSETPAAGSSGRGRSFIRPSHFTFELDRHPMECLFLTLFILPLARGRSQLQPPPLSLCTHLEFVSWLRWRRRREGNTRGNGQANGGVSGDQSNSYHRSVSFLRRPGSH